jgi:thiol-disulfide isomerase/thioredoxin
MKKWKSILLVIVVVFGGIVVFQQTKDYTDSGSGNNEIKPATGQNVRGDSIKAGPVIGMEAPEFTLSSLDGKEYALSDLKGEKPVLINFWASWCPPCKAEAPDLARLYKKYRNEMEIYAVNLTDADSVEGAAQFAKEYGFEFPVLLDRTGEVGRLYQAFSIPTSYFIDRDGNVQNKMIGITSPNQLEKMFQELIEKK